MKGQVQHVFIYLLTIIVVGLILLLGYKSIGGLMGQGCDVERATFASDLESKIESFSDYGDIHKKSLSTPCSFTTLCFANTSAIDENKHILFPNNPIIEDSVWNGIEDNIFLVNDDVTEPVGFVSQISLSEDVLCIQSRGGKFYLRFEGLGKKTRIGAD